MEEEQENKTDSNIFQKGFDRVKSLFRDEIDEYAALNAVYNPDEYKKSDIDVFLKDYELEFLSAGLNSRAFKVKDKDWIIKEGRWDLDFTLLGSLKLKLPTMLLQKFFSIFKYQFVPSIKNTQNDYGNYLEFVQYFGYFDSDRDYPHPNRSLMFNAQKNIRDTLLFYKPAVERKYKFKIPKNVDKVLQDKNIIYTNFLPKEYQLFGRSISKENGGKDTCYIVQEFVKGEHLAEVADSKLPTKLKKQLILMIYLTLLMHMQVGLLPDTKPAGTIKNPANWLTNTENIIVTKDRIVFIDTRWFWDVHSNFIKKGLFIPRFITQRARYSLKQLAKDL